ncbi:MAG: RNA polymerase sigma factor [Acidobacteriaceae bacterium]|nr:RNA polymerase sigma factor [Acidobacteriaceae bacterium]
MDNGDTRSDAELLSLSIEGDESAFFLLYERLKHNLFRYAYYMTGSKSTAEEITQDVFMTLLSKAGKYHEPQGDVAGFAFGIVKNLVRRIRRCENGFESLSAEESAVSPNLMADIDPVDAQLVRNELADQVQMAVASLPIHYREAVVLCDLCELSYSEAAARLRCSIGTVRSRLNRAHNVLARKLKPLQKTRTVGLREGCLI